jgi:hypothetical protein
MKTFLLVLAVFLLLCAAPAYCADNLGCGADQSAAQCLAGTTGNNFEGMSGGDYLSCFALGRKYQKCQESMTNNDTKVYECVSVSRAAKCFCDENSKKASGLCTYLER